MLERHPAPTALRAGVEALFVFGLSVMVLWVFADRTGYEGDDINSVVPMLNLRAALDGAILIYRPHWQPLSYELGAAVYGITGSVNAIFALAQIGIAAGIATIYYTVRAVGLPPLLFLPLLMLFPEIVYSGLYYNSSALGFPLACLAVFLALTGSRRRSAAAIGILLSLAILMRMDYVLVAPVVAAMRIWMRCDLWDVIIAALSGIAIFALALASGLLDPAAAIETYNLARAEIIARADSPGWNDFRKMMVTTVVFSPTGWVFLAIALIWTALTPRAWLPAAIGVLCLTPMLFSARNMLTAKYMLPVFALLPVIAALIWIDIADRLRPALYRTLTGLWIAMTAFLLVAALEPTKEAPHVQIVFADSRQIPTHDGRRTWGAYLWHMARLPHTKAETDAMANTLLKAVLEPRDVAVAFVGKQNLFEPGGIVWRNLQLALAQAGYHGHVVGHEALRFDLPAGPLFLFTADSRADHDLSGTCVIELLEKEAQATILSSLGACSAS